MPKKKKKIVYGETYEIARTLDVQILLVFRVDGKRTVAIVCNALALLSCLQGVSHSSISRSDVSQRILQTYALQTPHISTYICWKCSGIHTLNQV